MEPAVSMLSRLARTQFLAVALIMFFSATLFGASPAPSPAQAPAVAPSTAVTAPKMHQSDGPAVIGFLSQVIGWYRHLGLEQRLVTDPADMLFVADDRQMADQVLNLSFEFGKAQAALISAAANGTSAEAPGASADTAALTTGSAKADADIKAAQDRLTALQAQLAKAGARTRAELTPQIAAAQSELDLAQARGEAVHTIQQFESGNFHQEGGWSTGLAGQIDELEKSIPEAERNAKPMTPTSAEAPAPGGIAGIFEELVTFRRNSDTLDDTIEMTNAVVRSVDRMRAPLIDQLHDIDRRGEALAQSAAGDVAALRARRDAFQELIERHKLVAAAAIPLRKEKIILGLYVSNLQRWQASFDRQSNLALRRLMVRLGILIAVLGAIFAAAGLWRRFAFRYVQDRTRRYQLLQARRFVLAVVVTLVILFNFASEIGALATVMGFAAAGIAVALQNVILSLAGYFFLIGKFGIKVGDRVQVSGVTGDVVDIGLVKLSLMELSSANDHQPTGRVVVFSNAVVFQPSGNFFKQIPDTNFVWNEVALTLAPDCDYRLAEKRLLEAVEEVFARYRENIQRQYIAAEQSLNLAIDALKPQARLQLTRDGLMITLRYPAETRTALQTADEVARRLLDAIAREPGLKLVATASANIQAAPVEEASEHEEGNGTGAISKTAK
ncbi:MAG TPA: mechanosensitive ion channel family protein [Candidatus Binataceae bacterium]|nr:mechanosensitive ion channel family protein [Candidatus Binataceae bacterium]